MTKFAKPLLEPRVKVLNDVSLFSGLDLNAVFVTTPISSHFYLLDYVANNITKNIFVEKTLTMKAEDSKNICRRIQHPNCVNMVGYQKRYSVTFKKAYELLGQQAIGSLTSFTAYSYSSDFIGYKDDQIERIAASRGGVLRDLGSHAISLALMYFGDLIPVCINTSGQNAAALSSSSFGFEVKNETGLVGEIATSWLNKDYRMPQTGLTVNGTKGKLMVDDDKVRLQKNGDEEQIWYRQNLNDYVNFLLYAPEYYREDYDFVSCIVNGGHPRCTFDDASRVDNIIERALNLC